MSNIKFVSHIYLPEDQYTKELVYLEIDDKYRVCYLRKQAKNGGMFWSVPSVQVTQEGTKAYYEAFMQDSSFLEKDIKHFLDSRAWEKKPAPASQKSFAAPSKEDDLPF